jgi:hypothetical protein
MDESHFNKQSRVVINDLTAEKPKANYTINTLPIDFTNATKLGSDILADAIKDGWRVGIGVLSDDTPNILDLLQERERHTTDPLKIALEKKLDTFMGIKVADFKFRSIHRLAICDADGIAHPADCDFYSPTTEWNDIMPVVIKMEVLGYAMHIDPWKVDIVEYLSGDEKVVLSYDKDHEDSPISHYYYPAYYFVEWYNKQNIK